MKKLVIIMLVLLTMTQNSTAQTAGGETKIFPMFGLTLSKMNNDIILTDAGNGQGDELKPKYKFGITAGAEVRHRFKTTTLASAQVCSTQCTAQNIQTIPI